MRVKPNDFHYSFWIVITLLCLSCNDDSGLKESIAGSSSWISNLGLESNSGELSIINSNDYLIAGSDYILKVDVNGNVTEEIHDSFSQPASGLSTKSKIFNEKVYRFTSIGYGNEDFEKNIELEIYDNNGNLLESTVLDATYTLIDIIIDEDKMTLLTWDWNDPNTSVRTHIFQVDNNGQLLFENNLNSFSNIAERIFDLIILEDGNFLFQSDRTLYKADNTFEPISFITLSNTAQTFIEGPEGNIYVGGIIPAENSNYILKLDKELNQVNEITFNHELSSPIEPSLTDYAFGSLAVDDGNLYTLEVAYEYLHELRLQCFDLDLNKNNEFILEGSRPRSDLIINELGSVSFLYGAPYAPFDEFPDLTTPTEARLFKLDINCQLPDLVINN